MRGLSVSSGLIYAAEHTSNPRINNYFHALYFGLCTLTTVGFGDVYPVTSIVDGKIVCPFRDGEGKHQSIELKEGLVPIVSVGYVRQTRYTSVKWKPPGQEEWSDIPTNLLFH